MVKFYSNTLKVQWKPFNKNLTSTYHKTFDLGKIIFFSVSLFFVPHPKLKKLLIFFLFCQFLTSDPSPPIFHCEVCRSSNPLCILATSDKMDAEGEPGKYMYMHATDYHLQNQDVNYTPNFVCARIFYKLRFRKALLLQIFLAADQHFGVLVESYLQACMAVKINSCKSVLTVAVSKFAK